MNGVYPLYVPPSSVGLSDPIYSLAKLSRIIITTFSLVNGFVFKGI